MAEPEEAHRVIEASYCRFCPNGCPILVEIENGRAVSVTGDPTNESYQGYTCVKGRALPEQHNHPDRLLHSQRRMPDGTFEAMPSGVVMDEVAAQLREIVEQHGPDSVAVYFGTMVIASQLIVPFVMGFMGALGSRFIFNPNTIDQPGKDVAKALHGTWGAVHDFDDPEVVMVLGSNPFASYLGGVPYGHPGKWLHRWFENGCDLIVVDPRRTDFAKRATLHLQPRPGEDAAILAGMVRVILSEDLYDRAFVDEHVSGLDTLRDVVSPFTAEYVAERAGIDADDLVSAARMLARGRRGFAFAGTGPNMSGPGTLVEYLVRCLNTICGRWARAGDRVRVPGTLLSPQPARAQAIAPWPAYGLTEPLPGTDQRGSVAGLPTAALPAAILHDGDTRIRALISISGNPAAAIPDQLKVVQALEALELLVQVDITMSATAQLADYVVAPTMSLEVPSCTVLQDQLSRTFVGIGYGDPWAQYTKAVAERPAGADLLEEWEFLYGLAQRMDLDLTFGMPGGTVPPVPLDMEHAPTTDELFDLLTTGSRVPLDEVRKHPHGALFPGPRVEVEAKDPDCTDRLDVGNADMMRDLAEQATRLPRAADEVLPNGERLEFRLVSRRMQQAINSSGRGLRGLRKRPYNPAFIHPDDLERLGLKAGDVAEIRSSRAAIIAIVQPDETLRRGLVSMTHAFGGLPGRDDVRRTGSNTGRLLTVDADIQSYTGQPLMSNVPVAVRALGPQDDEHRP